MKRSFVTVLALGLVFSMGSLSAEQEVQQGPEDLQGQMAPTWELKTPAGRTMKLEDLKGQVVLMDFWATWCGPCKAAMPSIQKLHEKYKDKKVQILGINAWEDSPTAAQEYMRKNNFGYGLLLKGDGVAEKYLVQGIPTLVLIDKTGKVAFVEVGYNQKLFDDLSKEIDKLLKS